MTDDAHGAPGPAPRRSLLRTVRAVGVVLLVVGAAASVYFATRPVSFGWSAYAPLSEVTFSPGGVRVLHPGVAWSVAVAVVGVALVSGSVGYARGRRDGEQAPPTDHSGPAGP